MILAKTATVSGIATTVSHTHRVRNNGLFFILFLFSSSKKMIAIVVLS